MHSLQGRLADLWIFWDEKTLNLEAEIRWGPEVRNPMTPLFDDDVLTELARFHRHDVPPRFEAETHDLAEKTARSFALESDATTNQSTNRSIRAIIVRELSVYLCTDDPKYGSLRAEGRNATTALVAMLGATVATASGLPLAAATGCVAYVALAVAKLGATVFCDLYPPPARAELDASDADRKNKAQGIASES